MEQGFEGVADAALQLGAAHRVEAAAGPLLERQHEIAAEDQADLVGTDLAVIVIDLEDTL